MSMNVPPPDPSSAASAVEGAAGAAVTDLVGDTHPLAAPLDNRAERRQARRERFRLLIRRPSFIIGSLILLFWIVCAVLGDRITPDNPISDFFTPREAPSSAHWMGTDGIGRDVLSRVMAGSRDVLIAAPIAAIIGVIAGTLLGLMMGYYRGWVDEVLGRIVEALLSIPVILVAILIVATLGTSRFVVVMTVAVLFTPIVTRTIRAAVLSESQLDYVTSAKLRGESGPFVMTREILPNLS
ncbi:MAG: ABC transporter permease, partial [Ilumatobacteraceae bacterium]